MFCIEKLLLTDVIDVIGGFCWTWPNHFERVSLNFLLIGVFLNALESFHFFFFIILPHTHLNILISAALIWTLPIFSASPSLNKEGKLPWEGDDKGKI